MVIIGPSEMIKLLLTYPMTTCRNLDAILRERESMQMAAKYKAAPLVNWKQNDGVIIAGSVSEGVAKRLFPAGWKVPKPYLRIVKQPS